tara:strand:- start:479 stop:658 length:180 start_codon:yes stop_codon:yes gene_type:complete
MLVDRYQLTRSFTLEQFDRTIHRCEDVTALQEMCVRLFSQNMAHRSLYEQMLKERLPKM